MHKAKFHVLVCLLLVTIMLVSVGPASSQTTPTISVAPTFRPNTQLDSDGADIRYVDVELNVTTNVQFWTAQFSCTVNRLALTGYVFDFDSLQTPSDPLDNVPMVQWNEGEWGNVGFSFTSVQTPTDLYNPATGQMRFTASLLEPNAPLGYNGATLTLQVATLRYRVLPLTTAATSPFTCTSAFLDRNGRSVATARYTAPTPVSLLPGYQIRGMIQYQGRTNHAGINVNCGPAGSTVTAASGTFTLTNIRTFGLVNCSYTGLPVYLAGASSVNLAQQSYQLPLITLKGGNTSVTATTTTQLIDIADLTVLTSNFGTTTTATGPGNVNGDTAVNQADLALLTSNYTRGGPFDARHLLFGMARDYAVFANSRSWLGDVSTNNVTQFITGNNRIYWPTLSPDGARVAYVQEVTAFRPNPFTLPRYALFVGPVPGTTGATVRLTPATNWSYDAFAPSWSGDGSKIAFVCSQTFGGSALWYDSDDLTTDPSEIGFGELCVVDVNGRNLIRTEEFVEIHPPAWVNSTNVVVADAFSGALIQHDFSNTFGSAPITNIADASIPVYEDGVLFYVHNSTQIIRIASYFNPDPVTGVPVFPATAPGSFHNDQITGLLFIYYYDVSENGLSVIVDPDGFGFYELYNETQGINNPDLTFEDFVGVPSAVGAPFAGPFSYGWALKNTVDFAQ